MYASTDGGTTAPPKASLIEDCIDIWFSPASVFTRRGPSGSALGPFLVAAVLMVVLYYAALGSMQAVFDAEVARAITEAQAQNPQMSSEQVEATRGIIEGSIKYGAILFMPIVLLLLGCGVWLMSKMLGGSLSFGGGIMVASFAYFPKVFELLLVSVQGMVRDTSTWNGRYDFSWGLGRIMDNSGAQGVYNLLGRVDVFTIWVTILVSVGLVYAGKVEKTKAYGGAAVLWLLGAVPALIQVATGK
jgi:hypothetical protein